MRITNGMQSANMLRSLQGSNERSYKLQEQLSTGRRLNRPSDDPIGVARSLKYSRDLSENEQYTKNVKDAMSILDAADTALSGTGDVLHRLQEIAVYGANDSLPQASKDALALEVDELIGQLVQLGNSTHSGTYIFAGEKVLTKPYTLVPGTPDTVTYSGNAGKINYEIAPGVTDNVNYTGPEVFGPVSNDLFTHAIALAGQLRTGTPATIQPMETLLNADQDNLLEYRATIGAKYNKMELSATRLGSSYITINAQIAATEDTDIAEATMQLKLEENVYNAALAVGARVIPPSLVDFLK
jgi:flagellar hook-associated protein 3 FlgL